MAVRPDRAIPRNLEAEGAVLGAILLDNGALSRARQVVSAEDFYGQATRLIFNAMIGLHERGDPIDALTLASELGDDLERAGGTEYLVELMDGQSRAPNVEYYAELIKKTSVQREIARQAEELLDASLAGRDLAPALTKINRIYSTPTSRERVRTYSVADFINLELPQQEPLLEPWLFEKNLGMIYAKRGLGKTWFALSVGAAVATGTRFSEWRAPAPREVLYVDGEMPAGMLQQRMAAILANLDTDLGINDVPFRILPVDTQPCRVPPLDTHDGQRILQDNIGGARLVIIDNISTLMGSGSENDAEAWAPAQRLLLDLRRQGIAVLLVHHAGKGGTQRGTSRREDVLDTVIKLERPKDYRAEEGARFVVSFDKVRSLAGGVVSPLEARLDVDEVGRAVWTFASAVGVNRQRALEMIEDGMKPDEVARELGVGRATVYRWRKESREEGKQKGK